MSSSLIHVELRAGPDVVRGVVETRGRPPQVILHDATLWVPTQEVVGSSSGPIHHVYTLATTARLIHVTEGVKVL